MLFMMDCWTKRSVYADSDEATSSVTELVALIQKIVALRVFEF